MAATTEGTHQFRVIGTRPIRHDGVDKVTGRRATAPTTVSGHALRPGAPQPARPRAYQVDQDRQGAQARRASRRSSPRADLPDLADRIEQGGEVPINLHHLSCNILARDKVLYDGHAVAAVAATSPHIAEEALRLIEVEYEVLPPVMTVEDAMTPGAPILLPDAAQQGRRPRQADQRRHPLPVQARRRRGRLRQGRLRDRARVQDRDGPPGLHRAAQRRRHLQRRRPRHHLVHDPGQLRRALAERRGARHSRGQDPRRADRDRRRLRRQDHVYLEPLSALLSQKTGRPVKMTMNRARGLRATGPTPGSNHPLQDGRDQGRQDRRRRGLPGLRGRRLSRLAGGRRPRCASSPPTTSRTS